LSNNSKAWLPFDSIRTTSAMEPSTRWTSQGLNHSIHRSRVHEGLLELTEVKQG
jgi:hypothetical protein